MKTKLIILILITGLLFACGGQTTEAPASPPIVESAPATEALVPTDTAVSPTDVSTEVPTDEPTAEPVTSTGVSFANDIFPILQSRWPETTGYLGAQAAVSLKTRLSSRG